MSAWHGFFGLLLAHTRLVMLSLGLAVALGLPLAVLVAARPRARAVVLAGVGVVQTVPGLALLALMVPSITWLNEGLGLSLPALGFLPTVLALTVYSMLPVLRNAVTGLMGVEPALVEAATALGMTPRQRLLQVELPLALPVIRAGVRTAAVWCVGTATLATPLGQACLGNPIFTGLQTRAYDLVLVGCFGAALLAVTLDQLLGRLSAKAAAVLVCGGALVSALPWDSLASRLPGAPQADQVVVVGSKPFTEQLILAELIATRLEAQGLTVRRLEGLGSTVAFDALVAGDVHLYVDYTGTMWSSFLKRSDQPGRKAVREQSCAWLADNHPAVCLGSLGFDNAYALAVRQEDATERGWASIADLAPVASELIVGGDYELFQRAEWASVRETYGLHGLRTRTFDAAMLYEAAAVGEVDVVGAYTTDGRLDAFALAVLRDPEHALPPYEAVVLASEAWARRPEVTAALQGLLGGLDDATMREANGRVDVHGERVGTAAAWLDERAR